jgi:hypothetical protein
MNIGQSLTLHTCFARRSQYKEKLGMLSFWKKKKTEVETFVSLSFCLYQASLISFLFAIQNSKNFIF